MQETARNTVPPEKLVVSHLVRLSAFYGKRRLITVFTTARTCTDPQPISTVHISSPYFSSPMQSRHFRSGFRPKL
jgi:hypothetical protein